MLRFILGKSGSGKSTETLKIAGELADSNLPVMLIVPDQSTFECEKTLMCSVQKKPRKFLCSVFQDFANMFLS